jgi:uncharacterized protein YbjQ (UPF0145 family)
MGAFAGMSDDDIIITTMNDLPGFEIVEVYGEVFGLIVRARNAFSNIGASFRTIAGGEVKGYTKLRFDCNEIGDIMSEVAAYGTAVTVRRAGAYAPPAGG